MTEVGIESREKTHLPPILHIYVKNKNIYAHIYEYIYIYVHMSHKYKNICIYPISI